MRRERDRGLKRLERSLIHTPNPDSRSLGVRSVMEEAEEIISIERKHLEGDRERSYIGFCFSQFLFSQPLFTFLKKFNNVVLLLS